MTPKQRKAVYGLATAALVALIAFDVVKAEDITVAVSSVERIITALVTLLAYLNTHPE